ncbi:helicase-related protein [Motiliproteus sp. SC1-56]|uniref:helicase-related protein n=1 Tax=Motiliproteus sp. SC1-56 TaxID=2799565 RepID=UPI001A8FAD60|nr:helicase-related protein [Motiliproteus sp. SC1-56]
MTSSLPIDSIKGAVLSTLARQHLVVQADTGSGKSTRLPLWAQEQGRVLVVEPRRVACLALADYLASQLHSAPGEAVGYAIRFDSCFSAASRVVFVTPGIALRWLADNGLSDFDLVILDEFHERRWDTDLLLALLRNRDTHRLLLTSATLDAERLAAFADARVLRAEGRNHPVSVAYQSGGDVRAMPSLAALEERVCKAVESALPKTEGDLLVFLPGRGEIQRCRTALKGVGPELLALHGSVPAAEQRRALASGTRRRIILATNIAETSLTIPGVRVVIDSGLERRTHQRNGRTVLGLRSVSLASAEQRRGRAGRVAPGHCIRLYGEHAPLELSTPPEVLREELTEPVLAAACCGVPVEQLQFPDPLPVKSRCLAQEKLQRMGALDAQGLATDHGRRLYPLPIDSFFAHLVSAMPDEGCRGATVDLVAALSVSGRLLRMPGDEQGRQALSAWQPIACDATTLVKLVREPFPEALVPDSVTLEDARRLAKQLRDALGLGPLRAGQNHDRERWLRALVEAAPEIAFVRRQKRREAMGNGWSEVVVGRDSRLSDEAEAALVLDQYALPGRGVKETRNIATCCAPVSLTLLAVAGVGEERLAEASWEAGRLRVQAQRVYAGRVIALRERAPGGALARQALAELILAGRLLAPAGARLQDDLAAWALYQSLAEEQAPTTPEPICWLEERLARLGVEQGEDLALLEPEDLAFEGVPEWERERFDAAYPRQLSLGDLKLRVSYEPRRKRVVVEPVEGTRKTLPKRWELPRWKGWTVRYQKASRVVELK